MSTQWNVTGMGDYVGLNYMPLFHLLDRSGLTPDEWQHTFAGVQVIERAALAQIRLNKAT